MKVLLRDTGLMLWLPIAILALWWFGSAGSQNVYSPPLETILQVFARDWLGERFITDALPSIGKFIAGFLLAGLGGILLGLMIGMSRWLGAALDPLIQFFRAIPPPALLPVALLLFGIGTTMNIAVIVAGSIWPVLLNTIDGVRALDPQVVDMTRSYRLSRTQRIFKVLLPAAAPQIFAGLRVTLQLAIILIVVSEMFASTAGIGFYVLNSQQFFAVPETWAGTIVLGLLGYVATAIFVLIERRVISWHHGMYAASEKA
ncbi:ABC transporter permease [Glutamicibacter sp.]|uniref:ABC transporter permease n=1 Tax=Glutamicibacter sp. TaxID=1931995 RepID=UPI002B482BC1|nr:ABC transporter permease [Glutamicibacter sp.]HJX78353.1 ABC transporter permease [Glutamicibacter sp.]